MLVLPSLLADYPNITCGFGLAKSVTVRVSITPLLLFPFQWELSCFSGTATKTEIGEPERFFPSRQEGEYCSVSPDLRHFIGMRKLPQGP